MNSIAPSITDQMTALYVFVDDHLKEHPAQARWRASNHRAPAFTDAEVVTVALMQGVFGCDTLKRAYLLVASSLRGAFPRLPGYGQWLARLHRLSALVGQLLQRALGRCRLDGRLYVLDGLPVPVCKPIRHGRVRLLREDGAYFGKSSTGWFFGFRLHALVHHSGAIMAAVLTPANWPEQDAALALALTVDGGVALADLGYRSRGDELAHLLAEEADLLLITPADAGKKGGERRALVSSLRERIETSFSGLWARFADRVYSRSWQGLWSSLKLKMLHFNLCQAGLLPG